MRIKLQSGSTAKSRSWHARWLSEAFQSPPAGDWPRVHDLRERGRHRRRLAAEAWHVRGRDQGAWCMVGGTGGRERVINVSEVRWHPGDVLDRWGSISTTSLGGVVPSTPLNNTSMTQMPGHPKGVRLRGVHSPPRLRVLVSKLSH